MIFKAKGLNCLISRFITKLWKSERCGTDLKTGDTLGEQNKCKNGPTNTQPFNLSQVMLKNNWLSHGGVGEALPLLCLECSSSVWHPVPADEGNTVETAEENTEKHPGFPTAWTALREIKTSI